jgi:hypothetical protein
MFAIHIQRAFALVVLFIAAGLAPVSVFASSDLSLTGRSPDLPLPLCEGIRVPEGNRFAYKAYAVGVQLYRWNGTAWTLVEPIATLFADPDYKAKVGTHYLGPTWEGNSGGKVVASRVNQCTPDASAIPWLLLSTVTAEGPGVFGSVTFIQRVNTRGGLIPTAPGTSIGAVAPVPYTAEYYFYKD